MADYTLRNGPSAVQSCTASPPTLRYSSRKMARTAPVLYSVDLSECAAIRQLTTQEISEGFAAVLEGAGATILQAVSHTFPGAGLTCALLLTESHAILHTW